MDSIIIYWSNTGNTEKVAGAIREGLEAGGLQVTLTRVEDAGDIDFFDYDLVCLGFPSHYWGIPKPMDKYLRDKFSAYRGNGYVKWGAPNVPGKNVPIRASARPSRQGCARVSSLSTWASPSWTSCMWWGSFTGKRRQAPWGGLGTSGACPAKRIWIKSGMIP